MAGGAGGPGGPDSMLRASASASDSRRSRSLAAAVLRILPVAWAVALATLLLVLCLPDHGPEGSPLLVLLVLGFGIALYSGAALGWLVIAAERQGKGLEWGRGLSERELDLLLEAPQMPLRTLAEVLGSDTARGLSVRHALAREAEDSVARMEMRSPLRFALSTLALALHEQAFRPGRSGGAWPTAALLSVALLQAAILHPNAPTLPLGLFLPFTVLAVAIGRRWRAAWCLRMIRRGDGGALPRLGPVSVVRDGVEQEIPADRVVVGDLLVLKPGQELCADVRLVEITSGPTRRIQMELDEAPLDALRYRLAELGMGLDGEFVGAADAHGGDNGSSYINNSNIAHAGHEPNPPTAPGSSGGGSSLASGSRHAGPHVSFAPATFRVTVHAEQREQEDEEEEAAAGHGASSMSPQQLQRQQQQQEQEQGQAHREKGGGGRRRTCMALAGSAVKRGQGRGLVVSLPPHCELNRLRRLVHRAEWAWEHYAARAQRRAQQLHQQQQQKQVEMAPTAPAPLPRASSLLSLLTSPPSAASLAADADAEEAASTAAALGAAAAPSPTLPDGPPQLTSTPTSSLSPSAAARRARSRLRRRGLPPLEVGGGAPSSYLSPRVLTPSSSGSRLGGFGDDRPPSPGQYRHYDPQQSLLSSHHPHHHHQAMAAVARTESPQRAASDSPDWRAAGGGTSPGLAARGWGGATGAEEEGGEGDWATGPPLLLDAGLGDAEDGVLWVGVVAVLAGTVVGLLRGADDPLVMLLAASTLLFLLSPRGDLSGLWREALCRGAYGRMAGAVSVQEGDGVRAVEALALVDAVVLDKAGTLTESNPRLTAVVAGDLQLGADGDSLSAMLRHNPHSQHHDTSTSGGGGWGARSRSNSLSGSGGGGEATGRALLLQALEAWVLTSTLGDDATRKEQHQRRWRRQQQLLLQQREQQQQQAARQQSEGAAEPDLPSSLLRQPHFFFHDGAATTLRRQPSHPPPAAEPASEDEHHHPFSPPTRQSLGRLLESMLNLDKEWGALGPYDQALLLTMATTTPPALDHHHHPQNQRRPSSPHPTPAGAGSIPLATAHSPSSSQHPQHMAPPRTATALPPALVSLLLAKLRGEARLVCIAPYDAQVGFEARSYFFSLTTGGSGGRVTSPRPATAGEGNDASEAAEASSYKTFFRATPEALLAGCAYTVAPAEAGQQQETEEESLLLLGRGLRRVPLDEPTRRALEAAWARLAARGYTLIGVAAKAEAPDFEQSVARARARAHRPTARAPEPAAGNGGKGEEEDEGPLAPPSFVVRASSTASTASSVSSLGAASPSAPSSEPGQSQPSYHHHHHHQHHGAVIIQANTSHLTGAVLLGVLAFADPPTAAAARAVAAMRAGGMCRVLLLTGEGREAGLAVARDVGLLDANDGDEEAATQAGCVASAPEVRERAGAGAAAEGVERAWRAALAPEAVAVVCRASPEDRARAVAGLEGAGYTVAVTGNGLGDVPALRRAAAESGAGVGVVLDGGVRGVTDMARGAARLVLRDGDLASLAACLREARRLYAGARAAAAHTLACHLALAVLWPPLAYVSSAAAAGGATAPLDALPLRPAQLLLLEALRIAGAGVGLSEAALADDDDDDDDEEYEEEKEGKQPQARAARFWGSGALIRRAFLGTFCLTAAAAAALVYGGAWDHALRLPTLAFGTLLLAQPLLALNLRSAARPCLFKGGAGWLWLWLAAATAFLGLAAVHTGVQRALGLVALPARLWGGVVIVAVVCTCWMEPAKCLGCCLIHARGGGRGGSAAAATALRPPSSSYGAVGGLVGEGATAAARAATAMGAEGERAPLLGLGSGVGGRG